MTRRPPPLLRQRLRQLLALVRRRTTDRPRSGASRRVLGAWPWSQATRPSGRLSSEARECFFSAQLGPARPPCAARACVDPTGASRQSASASPVPGGADADWERSGLRSSQPRSGTKCRRPRQCKRFAASYADANAARASTAARSPHEHGGRRRPLRNARPAATPVRRQLPRPVTNRHRGDWSVRASDPAWSRSQQGTSGALRLQPDRLVCRRPRARRDRRCCDRRTRRLENAARASSTGCAPCDEETSSASR